MTMGKMKDMAAETQLAPLTGESENPNKMIERVIRKQWSKIEAVMPQHLSSERLLQLTISAVNKTPKLLECDLATLLSCVMRCSALGLEPSAVDGLGYAYILPYKNKGKMEATFILGYKGMIKLAYMGGEVESIEARAVHVGDEFEYEFGLNEKLRHTPKGAGSNENLTHVYVLARFKNGGHYFDVMTRDEVEAIRKRSKAGDSGAWVSDYEAMAKKTVVRRAFPYLPLPPMAQKAAEIDESDGGYVETINSEPLIPEVLDVEEASGAAAKEILEARNSNQVRKAVCRNCGNMQDFIAPDATLDDLNTFLCCDRPDYEWTE